MRTGQHGSQQFPLLDLPRGRQKLHQNLLGRWKQLSVNSIAPMAAWQLGGAWVDCLFGWIFCVASLGCVFVHHTEFATDAYSSITQSAPLLDLADARLLPSIYHCSA
jgi:hypothetical protein